ncbi:MAG TPA: VTT domain-containing protein, partial [Candidatus Eisenbacteria bacterium]|nr:VTT domain-containing protein [Candidatus Eisenbacteria bacterium]
MAAGLLIEGSILLAPRLHRAEIEAWIRGAGVYGPLLLLAIQAGQILAAPIPGVFVPVIAGVLYGPIVGPLATSIGTILGSAGAYAIGHWGGRPLAERVAGKEQLQRAQNRMGGKRWLMLIPLFMIPFSPADALCFVAGIIEMGWRRFLTAVLLGRIPKDALVAVAAA